MDAIVSSKGQVVIPAEIRHRLGIGPGTHLTFQERGGEIVVRKSTADDPVARAFGCVPARPGEPPTTDALLAELRGSRP